jgi:hypothetical protein
MDDWAGVDLAAAQRSSLVGATSSWRIGQRWRSVGRYRYSTVGRGDSSY